MIFDILFLNINDYELYIFYSIIAKYNIFLSSAKQHYELGFKINIFFFFLK
jgi:hypothetical protein